MLTILLGPSCSGKTTFQKDLVKEGFYAVRSATTRPRRMGEDASAYYFLKDPAFAEWKRKGDLICTESSAAGDTEFRVTRLPRRHDRPNRVVVLTVGGTFEFLARHH